MALPLIPFAAGVAVGSLATLGATDNPVRDRIVRGAKDLYASLTGGAQSVVAMIPWGEKKGLDLSDVSEAADEVVEKAEAAGEAVKQAAKKTRKRATAKVKEVTD